MSKSITAFFSISILILSGCASNQYSVKYDTNPEGASVVCKGINKGYSPVTLYYTLDENNKKTGKMNTISCTANWISGAKRDFSNTLDLKKYPNGVIKTLSRPNVEGYAQDAEFALKVQSMRYQKRQAEAAEDAAYEASRAANATNRTVNCYTYWKYD
jgi:hypothetical protein